MSIFDKVRFCGACGLPLTLVDQSEPLARLGKMWRTLECSSLLGPTAGHDWKVVKRWDVGPKFDPRTGEQRRA